MNLILRILYLAGLEYLSIDEMEKNDNDDDLLNEEVIISMLNFNEEKSG